MSTIDEILASMPDDNVGATIDGVLVIDTNTRQITLPSSEFVFGVESDTHSERKYFMCSRIVGNGIDLASCFIRVNYRNANGETDIYLVDDVRVVGDNILFSWLLSKKVTIYRGQVQFVVCASRLGGNGSASVEWHTTVAKGTVLEGVEPDIDGIVAETDDALAVLLTTVDTQRENVIKEGVTQVAVVQAAAEAAKNDSVGEIEAKGANTLASIPDDYTALGVAVNAIDRGTAPGIVCEVEGSSVFVSDASNKPVQNIRIFGKSTQDGVPSPENPVEIKSVENPVVTVCGKNLLKNTATTQTLKGVTFSVNEDGSFTAKGTSTGDVYFGVNYDVKGLIPGQQYYLNGCPNGGGANTYRLYAQSIDGATFAGDIGSGTKFTAKDGQWQVLFAVYRNVTVDFTVCPMLRLDSVNSADFEPYNGGSLVISNPASLPGIPVTSGGNYTDSDGQQWICDEVDLERGVYVQRIGKVVFDGNQAWSAYGSADDNNRRFRSGAIMDTAKGVTNANSVAQILCSALPVISGNSTYSMNEGISLETNKGLSVYVADYAGDTNAWVSYLKSNPMTVLYAIETPIETPLSETELAAWRTLHTNKPNTTVLNDAGAHMAVAYIADTKLYIDNKIAALMSGK